MTRSQRGRMINEQEGTHGGPARTVLKESAISKAIEKPRQEEVIRIGSMEMNLLRAVSVGWWGRMLTGVD